MAKTAITGPLIVYGDRNPPGTGATGSVNPDKAPSLIWGGVGLLDPRVGYNVTRGGSLGWGGIGDMVVVDQVPSTIATNNIAATQTVTSGSAFTLVSATGAGITVLSAAQTVWSSGNTIPANALAIDGAPGIVAFGLASVSDGYTTVSLYDPTKAIARNVRLTSASGGDTGTVTVAGYDLYGYAMSEAIAVNAGTVRSGAKAFKFITSATLSVGGAMAAGALIGTGDVFGFPIRVDTQGYVAITWNAAYITASTGFVAAVTTDPATTTTGDVRGTYAVQTASDNAKRLQIFMSVSPANLGTSNPGLFGVAQA